MAATTTNMMASRVKIQAKGVHLKKRMVEGRLNSRLNRRRSLIVRAEETPPPPAPAEGTPPVEGTPTVEAAAAPVEEETVVAEEEAPPPPPPPPPPVWYPGSERPLHLDGTTLAGDYGFDPLSLGSDPELLDWFVQAELQHARWAMLAAVGILVPELLNRAGIAKLPLWFVAGEANYGLPFAGLLFTQLFLMGWVEQRRWADMLNPGSMNEDPLFPKKDFSLPEDGTPGYPGGFFDPFGFADDKKKFDELKVKEIKNGRLAMVAFVGFAVQGLFTGTGPIDNLVTHFNSPADHTIFQRVF